jgi:beta-lactamase class A
VKTSSIPILRWISLFLITCAIVIATLELSSYSRARTNFPSGLDIGGVPVGGLTTDQASERLLEAFAEPIEVHYGDAVIQIKPSTVGYEIDVEIMLAAAELQRVQQPFWDGFWGYLWNQSQSVTDIPLKSSFSEDRLRTYLKDDIASRYDTSPTSASPIPGTTTFQAGESGTTLNIDRAVELITDALNSPTYRIVNLTYNRVESSKPSIYNLEVMLKELIQVSGFQGVVELYMTDLQTYQNIHFVSEYGNTGTIPTDVAFSGWSTIKIPVMISAFRRLNEPAPAEDLQLMANMIERSDNDSTDALAEGVIDGNLAPMLVTQDMQTLGLANTFWGGFFYIGAPLLNIYDTPANQRTDIDTGPDPYDQTSPADLGILLEDIYQCATDNGGALIAAFPGEITQSECEEMITLLSRNDINQMIQAGLPYGTIWAHKHGWAVESADGLMHTIGDAGVAYTPGGDFVLVVFVNDPVQAVFDQVNELVANLGKAVYNYFNLSQ